MNESEIEKKVKAALSLCTDAQWQRLQDGFYDEAALECKEALEELGFEREFDMFAQLEKTKPKTITWLEKVRQADAERVKRERQKEEARCRSESRALQKIQNGYGSSSNGDNIYD